MIEMIKEILGISEIADYDMYIVIICTVGILWIVKAVINGIYETVLHIFI